MRNGTKALAASVIAGTWFSIGCVGKKEFCGVLLPLPADTRRLECHDCGENLDNCYFEGMAGGEDFENEPEPVEEPSVHGFFGDNALVTDLKALSGLTELTTINISETKATNLRPLSELTGLKSLFLPDTVTDLSPLSGLTGLTSLGLGNQVTDLSPLSGLIKLTNLQLPDTVTDLNPLSGLIGLTSLGLGNQVTDLSPLSGLTGLTSLNISETKATNLSPLSGLIKLTNLQLPDTVTDLSPLSGLIGLTSLGLSVTSSNSKAVEALRRSIISGGGLGFHLRTPGINPGY
jgi:hypothetical protein